MCDLNSIASMDPAVKLHVILLVIAMDLQYFDWERDTGAAKAIVEGYHQMKGYVW